MVPKKLHAKIAQGGRFFRSLPSGTRVTHDGIKPPSSSLKAKKPLASTASTSSAPRIDDEAGESVESEIEFQVVSLYDGAGEDDSEIPWVIESASQEDADKTVAEIEKALGLAKSATHVGWLTVPRALSAFFLSRGFVLVLSRLCRSASHRRTRRSWSRQAPVRRSRGRRRRSQGRQPCVLSPPNIVLTNERSPSQS